MGHHNLCTTHRGAGSTRESERIQDSVVVAECVEGSRYEDVGLCGGVPGGTGEHYTADTVSLPRDIRLVSDWQCTDSAFCWCFACERHGHVGGEPMAVGLDGHAGCGGLAAGCDMQRDALGVEAARGDG